MRTAFRICAVVVLLETSSFTVGNCDGAGNCYVSNIATGTGSGADWANACTDFTGACDVSSASMRGTTIWVGGTPGAVNSGLNGQAYTVNNFSAPDSGTLPITIIDASAENHGTNTGWNKISALGQVVFNGPISITTDYWVFNGQFRAGNNFTTESQGGGTYHDVAMGYRMQVSNTTNSSAIQISGSHVTLKYIFVQGSCVQGQITSAGLYGQTYTDNGVSYSPGITDEYLGYSWISYTGADSVQAFSGANFTFEYNMFSKNHMGPATLKSQAISIGDISGLIVRYNHFHNITGQAILTDSQADGTAFTPNWYFYGNDIFWDTGIHTGAGYGLNFGIVNLTGETLNGGVIHVYNNTIAGINVAACTSTQPCNTYALNLNGTTGGSCSAHTQNCIGSTAPSGTVYNNLWWNPYVAANITSNPAGNPQWTPTGDYGEGVCATTGCTNGGTFTVVGANDSSQNIGNPFTSFNAVMGSPQWYNFNFLPKPDTLAGLTIPSWNTTPPGCDSNLNCESNDGNYVTRGVNRTVDRGAFQINPRILTGVFLLTPGKSQTGSVFLGVHVGSTVTLSQYCTWSSAPTTDSCPEGTPPFNKRWASLDTATATVDQSGVVTGVSPHNTFIRLYYGGTSSGNNSAVVVSDGSGTMPVATLPTGIVRTGSPLAFSGFDTTAFDAAFPTVFSDPCPVTIPGTCTRWKPMDTATLVSNIASSQPGDTIELAAGTTYTTKGTFFLRARANPAKKWTYIVSSNMSSLPPQGIRVSPNDAVNMPTIVQTGAGITFEPKAGADHWWIAGLNMVTSTTGGPFPPGSAPLVSPDAINVLGSPIPDSITVDRCYIHTTVDMKAGLYLSASHFALLDSYVGPAGQKRTQSQAAGTNLSPGPLKIINNFFSAHGEDFMIGGGGGWSSQYVVSDVYIKNNLFWKDPSWRAIGNSINPGYTYEVDNNMEFKMCNRCLIDGNIFQNNWQSGQTGNSAGFLTVTSSQQGANSVNNDVTFSNNIFTGQVQGMAMTELGGTGQACASFASPCSYPGEARRLNVFNNLYIMGPQGPPGGRAGAAMKAAVLNRVNTDWLWQHNTWVGPYLTDYPYCSYSFYLQRWSLADIPATQNLWLLDNVVCRQIAGNSAVVGLGTPFIADMMSDPPTVPYTTRFVGNMMQTFSSQGDHVYTWPPGNGTSPTFTYVSPTTGNFQLDSPKLTGSDGQQTGINYSVLMAHQHAPLGSCSISGTASGVISSGVLITLTGQVTTTIFTQADGTYTIPNLPSGSYTISPWAVPPDMGNGTPPTTYSFMPTNIPITLTSQSCTSTGNNFQSTAAATYSISGTVGGATAAGVTMTLTGGSTGTTTTDSSGNYTFAGLAPATYTITPSKAGYTFSPTSQAEMISTANITRANFTSTAATTYTISGSVGGAVSTGVTVNLSGASTGSTTTDASGYSFGGEVAGTYMLTPAASGYSFSPVNLVRQ